MTYRKQELIDLRNKVKAGNPEPLDFVEALGARPDNRQSHASRAFLGSLDAAKALHEAVLPGWGPVIDVDAGNVMMFKPHSGNEWEYFTETQDTNTARAWLLAILEALIAQEADA